MRSWKTKRTIGLGSTAFFGISHDASKEMKKPGSILNTNRNDQRIVDRQVV